MTRGIIRKDATMRSKLALIALGCSALAACNTPDIAEQGVKPVNVPVVTATDYVFDAAAPNGALPSGEVARLSGWFQGLRLGYGDAVYVDSPYAPGAREQVARIAGQYGLLVQSGAPVTPGVVEPGNVRVVVSRRRAEVPGCPNWSTPSQPNFENRMMSNLGCGVNSNLAAMVADPVDLIHGSDGGSVMDAATAAKAVQYYRTAPPTGAKGLQEANPKGGK